MTHLMGLSPKTLMTQRQKRAHGEDFLEMVRTVYN